MNQSESQNYTALIHKYFLERCRKQAVLTIDDWSCIQSWRERGIPAACVFKGIDRAFAKTAAEVTSLLHCAWAVKEVCRETCGARYVS
jgi:hypothetical protein